MEKQTLDQLDKKILQYIHNDARLPFLEVARACGMSGAAIHYRVQKLVDMGVIKGSQFVLSPEEMGFQTTAFVGISLRSPEFMDDIVLSLKNIPEIVECHYTTGKYDLLVKVHARNNTALLKIIKYKIQPLRAVRCETMISFNTAFTRQLSPDCIELDEE